MVRKTRLSYYFLFEFIALTLCLGCDRLTAMALKSENSAGYGTAVTPGSKPSTQAPQTPSIPVVPTGWGQAGAIITMTEEFLTPEYKEQSTLNDRVDLMSDNNLTPLCHYNGSTYFVWTDTYRRTFVTKIRNRMVETVPLDANPDYTRTTDGHGRYSLGIDSKGYIHIIGDMHNYTEATVDSYVPRYQRQSTLYWKSIESDKVSGGFSFVGGRGASTTLPGTGWTLGRFFTDNNGELYYSSRVKAINGGHYPGEIGLAIYRYNVNSSTWTALGGYPEQLRPGPIYKVVMWDIGGYAPHPPATTSTWFQGMLSTVKFDSRNRMQVASSINTDTSLEGNNRVFFAMSPDGGSTWTKANGAPIRGLPVRAVDSHPDVGDIVTEDLANHNFSILTSVMTDKDGNIGVLQDKNWWVWNGSKWAIDTTMIPKGEYYRSDFGNAASDGSLVLTVSNKPRIVHAAGFGKPGYNYDIKGYYRFISVDEYALRKTGVVYGVAFTPDAKRQAILKITATPAP